jgi:hypothetical protein
LSIGIRNTKTLPKKVMHEDMFAVMLADLIFFYLS